MEVAVKHDVAEVPGLLLVLLAILIAVQPTARAMPVPSSREHEVDASGILKRSLRIAPEGQFGPIKVAQPIN